jgi:hypothetical protein
MSDVIRTSNSLGVIKAWMQTQWERIPAVPHNQPGSYARGYDGGMVDILRGLQATLDKLPPAHETLEGLCDCTTECRGPDTTDRLCRAERCLINLKGITYKVIGRSFLADGRCNVLVEKWIDGPAQKAPGETPEALSANETFLLAANQLRDAAVSFAGDVGLHTDAWLWHKVNAFDIAKAHTLKADECHHTLIASISTLIVIDPYKAKCRVCYNFFDLTLTSQSEDV